jgi:phospholipase/carboxylesterase
MKPPTDPCSRPAKRSPDIKPIATSLVHRILPPEGRSLSHHPVLILLHGRGADEEDLLGLASSLDQRFFVVSAQAPYPFSAGGGYTWYDAGEIGAPEPTMFRNSYDRLVTFLRDVIMGYPVDAGRVFLFGFSMGAVMSYTLGLTHPDLIRGVCANSGYLPEGTFLTYRGNDLAGTDFFISHGIHDPIIPVEMAHRARALFQKSNAHVTYREYPMAHQISEQSLADVAAWTTEKLGH